MRIQIVLRYLGVIFLINAAFMFLSAGIGFYNGDSSVFPLLYTSMISALFGIFPIIFVPEPDDISHIEGNAIVVTGWLSSCIMGMIPYIMWGGEFTITNAFFETVSGFTTTGASILNNIEAVPKGLLFWRASTHWIGGVGIIIFVLAVLPSLGFNNMILYRSELSPAALRHFKMRTSDAIKVILYVYIGLTILQTVALLFCGMNLFDAVTHTFATVATGGFSTKNGSVADFHSVSIEIVIMIFMILSGMNFSLLYAIVIGKFSKARTSTVVKYYIMANLVAILIASFNTWGTTYDSYWQALRFSAFQILSVGTSTGFANADSSVWPGLSQLIIIFFTLQCACAGSTSGGIKVDRIIIFYKSLIRHIKRAMYPNAVFNVKVDEQKINDDVVAANNVYILIYIVTVFLATIILSAMDVDLLSAFSGSAAMMGNVGPGLGQVGSLENFSLIPDLGKWVLSFTMIFGRLEIYGLIVFLFYKYWK